MSCITFQKIETWNIDNEPYNVYYVIEANCNTHLGSVQRNLKSQYEYNYKPSSKIIFLSSDELDQISKFISILEANLLEDIYDKAERF
jgi:hypothetical protein